MIRILTPLVSFGGSEMSALTIAKMLSDEGRDVTLHPWGEACGTIRQTCQFLGLRVGSSFQHGPPQGPRAELMLYVASNSVLDPRVEDTRIWEEWWEASDGAAAVFNWRMSERMRATYDLWDGVAFLSSELRDEAFADGLVIAGTPASVLAPAVTLEPFLGVRPDYDRVTFIRHSAGYKWPAKTREMVGSMLAACPRSSFRGMGHGNNALWARRMGLTPWNAEHVPDFLAGGSCFFYPLAEGCTEQGPRVVVEAMAAGLPVIADRKGGMIDRVTPETGWLVEDHKHYESVAREISRNPGILREKGEAARERARTAFNPTNWLNFVEGV